MGARPYMPTLGRFLTTDPIENGTSNDYTYVNDPINQVDLDGNVSIRIPCLILCIPVLAPQPKLQPRTNNGEGMTLKTFIAINVKVAKWVVTATTPVLALDHALKGPMYSRMSKANKAEDEKREQTKEVKEHTSNKSPSNREVHQNGRARGERDRGGEKKDPKMPYRNK